MERIKEILTADSDSEYSTPFEVQKRVSWGIREKRSRETISSADDETDIDTRENIYKKIRNEEKSGEPDDIIELEELISLEELNKKNSELGQILREMREVGRKTEIAIGELRKYHAENAESRRGVAKSCAMNADRQIKTIIEKIRCAMQIVDYRKLAINTRKVLDKARIRVQGTQSSPTLVANKKKTKVNNRESSKTVDRIQGKKGGTTTRENPVNSSDSDSEWVEVGAKSREKKKDRETRKKAKEERKMEKRRISNLKKVQKTEAIVIKSSGEGGSYAEALKNIKR